jgi:adenylate cyclase
MIFRARQLSVALVGGAWFAVALLVWLSGIFNLRDNVRELAFDNVLPVLAPRSAPSPVMVVDIDSESLARYGPWPWSRLVMADLLDRIAQAKPAVLGLNILLSEPDRLSPAGLARNLGIAADREDIASLASKLPDGDAAVAKALAAVPSVLGFVLDPVANGPPPSGVPFLARGRVEAPDIWQAAGAIGALPAIAEAGAGFGALVLMGDSDGDVRRVPLLVMVGGQPRPGFAVEVVRLAAQAGSFILDTDPQRLRIGPVAAPIDADASLRVLPRPTRSWSERTIPAWKVLDDPASRARLAGRIVLVGSGAPEVNDLRQTPVSEIAPSVQIQADAVETLLGNALPRRPPWISGTEILGATILCLVAIAIALFRRPVAATTLAGVLCLAWAACAIGAFLWHRFLVDMAGPPALAVVVFAATALGGYAQNERRERRLRRRFEQHLAPDVVQRLVDDPTMLRLGGETREVTAMFTDIEGFTSLTDRSDAGEVVRLLDGYLAIVTDTVVAHCGMVDKLIGDGVFALFNVPLDLANHARHALDCANAIVAATENYRNTPLALKLELGRTRVGIESGSAIVGDVGGGSKLDYTALGNVVNTASRLEGMNKELKTSICIGPEAAARLDDAQIERVSTVKVRGRSAAVDVFTVAGWSAQNAPPPGAAPLASPKPPASPVDAIAESADDPVKTA